MFALAAYVYPGAVRATGVGSAVAFGRTGGDYQRLHVLVGDRLSRERVLLRLDRVRALCATFVALALVRRHVARA